MSAAGKLATYDDLLALPESTRAEIVRGEIEVRTMHATEVEVQARIWRALGGLPDERESGPGGWWIFLEVELGLSRHDVLRPDLSGWRRERLRAPWSARPVTVVPDWICEIVCPGRARFDRVTKANLYLEAGVPSVWLVDPDARVLEVLVRAGTRWLEAGRFSDGDVVHAPPFPDVELDVSSIFPMPLDGPTTGARPTVR